MGDSGEEHCETGDSDSDTVTWFKTTKYNIRDAGFTAPDTDDDEIGESELRPLKIAENADCSSTDPPVIVGTANPTEVLLIVWAVDGKSCNTSQKRKSRESEQRIKKNKRLIRRKSLTCDICSKKFATTSNLKRHQRIHENLARIPCEINGCEKTFANGDALKDHVRYVHEKQTFVCKVCKSEFANRGALHNHTRIKHNDKRT